MTAQVGYNTQDMRTILIKKANGVMEPFDVTKLQNSLRRSGATPEQVDYVVKKITRQLKPGDATSVIYKRAFAVLKKMERSVAARYSLRRSLAELGPSGFPFEIFISRVFESLGYTTRVGEHLQGKCIDHEVDLIAWKEDEFIMGEVKFHNNSDLKNDSKTIMYIHSRYEDLKRSRFDDRQKPPQVAQGWLITNTKFTDTTIKYAGCYGLKLLGWNFPYQSGSLQSLIEANGLEPVTILTSLTVDQKRRLMDSGVVMCQRLRSHPAVLANIGLSKRKQAEVMDEVMKISNCQGSENCKINP